MKKLYKFICVIFVCFSFHVHALTLSQAYESALSYNQSFLTSVAKGNAGQELQIQGRAALLPQISGSGTMTEAHLNSMNVPILYHQVEITAQLQQVVFDFGKFSEYSRSKFATQLSELKLSLARQQLVVDVAQAYFNIIDAILSLNTCILHEKQVREHFDQVNKAFSLNDTTLVDMHEAETQLAVAIADKEQAKHDLVVKQDIFFTLTGLNISESQVKTPSVKLQLMKDQEVDKWINLANQYNIDMQIAAMQMQIAKTDINIAISGYIPNVSANASYQYQGNTSIDSSGNQTAAQTMLTQSAYVPGSFLSNYSLASTSLQVNIPIYAGGAVASKVRAAKDNYVASQHQFLAVTQQTTQNIKDIFFDLQAKYMMVRAQALALKSANTKLHAAELGYKTGLYKLNKIIDAQYGEQKALQDYYHAYYMYLMTQIRLNFAVGQCDAHTLQLIDLSL